MLWESLYGYPTVVMAVLHCYKHLVPHVADLEDLEQLKAAVSSINWNSMCSLEEQDDSWDACQRQWQGRTDDGDSDGDGEDDGKCYLFGLVYVGKTRRGLDYVDLHNEVEHRADAQVVSASQEPSTFRVPPPPPIYMQGSVHAVGT
jgi:hypothetical protein